MIAEEKVVMNQALDIGFYTDTAQKTIKELKTDGLIYEPKNGFLAAT